MSESVDSKDIPTAPTQRTRPAVDKTIGKFQSRDARKPAGRIARVSHRRR